MIQRLLRSLGWRVLLSAVIDDVEKWLTERALRLPKAKRAELCKRLKISEESALAIEEAIRQAALESLRNEIAR